MRDLRHPAHLSSVFAVIDGADLPQAAEIADVQLGDSDWEDVCPGHDALLTSSPLTLLPWLLLRSRGGIDCRRCC